MRTHRGELIGGIMLAAVGVGAVASLQAVDIYGRSLETSGWAPIAHALAAVVFVACLLVVCAVCGGVVFAGLRRQLGECSTSGLSTWVAITALGAIFLGVVFASLGLLNLLTPAAAWSVYILGLAAAPLLMRRILCESFRRTVSVLTRGRRSNRVVAAALMLLIVGAGTAIIMLKVVYPGEYDDDAWTHYLHYYDAVARSGGTWPNELWWQFFHSKGAGLHFFADLLAGPMLTPAAGFVLLALATLTVADLAYRVTRGRIWALCAAALFLLYILSPYGRTLSFSKHHVSLMTLLLVLAWSSLRWLTAPQRGDRRLSAVVGIACGLYLGFYIPQSVAIAIPALGLSAIATAIGRRRLRPLAFAACLVSALLGGCSAALGLNYVVTGLVEAAPSATVWSFGDQQRFDALYNRYVMEYFFCTYDHIGRMRLDVARMLHSEIPWIEQLCRWIYFRKPFLEVTPVVAATAVVMLLLQRRSIRTSLRTNGRYLLGRLGWAAWLFAFLAGAVLVALEYPGGGTLRRGYLFTGALLILLLVVCWSALLANWRRRTSLVTGILVLVCLIQPVYQAIKYTKPDALALAMGRISMCEALESTSRDCSGHITFADHLQTRRRLTGDTRVLQLTYEPGPGSFLPGRPLISDGFYAFHHGYERILFGSPEVARSELRAQHIEYVSLHLRGDLFIGIPYSDLFDPRRMNQWFELVREHDGFVLLRWRRSAAGPRIPSHVLEAIDLKRSAVFHDLYSSQFEQAIAERLQRIESQADSRAEMPQRLVAATVDAFRSEVAEGDWQLEESQELFTDLTAKVAANVAAIAAEWLETRRPGDGRKDQSDLPADASKQLARSVRLAITQACRERLGTPIADAVCKAPESEDGVDTKHFKVVRNYWIERFARHDADKSLHTLRNARREAPGSNRAN